MNDLKELLRKRILVLDGAMGTMIQRHVLTEKDFRGARFKDHPANLQGNNDLLSLTRSDVIREIHAKYFAAGADIAETNTFSSTSIAQADYALEDVVYDLNYQSAKIAREVADDFTAREPGKPRFVAGAMGPTNKTASISPKVNDPGFRAISFDELKEAYKVQARGLLEGGVDAFLVETVFDTLNAKAALYAIQELLNEKVRQVPVMVSGTITDASGRTLSGQTTEAFLISLSHFPLLTIGLNCALGAKQLRPYLQVLAREADFFISVHPNAGLPNEFGEYEQSPEDMADQIREFLDEGLVNIIGGCCGTTPEHIQKLSQLASEYSPRKIETEFNLVND